MYFTYIKNKLLRIFGKLYNKQLRGFGNVSVNDKVFDWILEGGTEVTSIRKNSEVMQQRKLKQLEVDREKC